jgi:hypothetical protein
MAARGRLDPDVGYWAERWDPSGSLHPLYYTSRVGKRWVNVTTLPALYAAYPLFRVGGYRAALIVPMLGSVAAAFAARALAGRLGASTRTAWHAFWLVGLGSPLAVYALDFWEHSLGVACMAWGVVLLLDAAAGVAPRRSGVLAGAAFGLGATMRTEALAYATVSVGVAALTMVWHRARVGGGDTLRSVAAVTASFVLGAGAMLVANAALEEATLGQQLRSVRAAGTAVAAVKGAGDDGAPSRLREAAVTSFGVLPSLDTEDLLAGLGLVACVAIGVAGLARRRSSRLVPTAAMSAAVVLYGVRVAHDPSFVPGFLIASPLAVAGLVLGLRSGRHGVVWATATAALPLVWAFQFRGGAAPQWGGRYVLTTSLLLTVVGLVCLAEAPTILRRCLILMSLAVTGMGLAWLSIRSHDIARAMRWLDRRTEPVLVSRLAFFIREGGATFGTVADHRALTAQPDEMFSRAGALLDRAGIATFSVVEPGDGSFSPVRLGPFVQRSAVRLRLFHGIDLRVGTYVREDLLPHS